MKLLFRIASAGVENRQAKILCVLRGHLLPNYKPSHNGHSERGRGMPWHNAQVTSRDASTSLDMTARSTISALLVDVARRLRYGSKKRAPFVFLVEGFYRDSSANLSRPALLRLYRDGFSDGFDRDGLSNFRRGCCCL